MIREKSNLASIRKMRSETVDVTPPAKLRPSRLAWAFWTMTCAFTLTGALYILFDQLMISDNRVYKGKFTTDTRTLEIRVPAGTVIAELFVSEGDTVVAGQRLAKIDETAISEQLSRTALELEATKAAKNCLLKRGSSALPNISQSEIPAAIETKLRECKNFHRVSEIENEAIRKKIYSLQKLHDTSVKAILNRSEIIESLNPKDVYFQLEVARQKHETLIHSLEIDLARSTTKHEVALLAKVDSVQRDQDRLSAEQARFQSLLEHPWLIAPSSGSITRLRSINSGSVFPEDTSIGFINTDEAKKLVAKIKVSEGIRGTLSIGDIVWVRISGMSINTPLIKANVSSIKTSASSDLEIMIVIDADDIEERVSEGMLLQNLKNADLEGGISLQKEKLPLRSLIRRSLHEILI
jgi:multidrug efflux pump subunit AcrA (membrane-fusion protein)